MLDRPSIAVKKSVVMRVGALLAMMAILVLSNPAPDGVFAHPHDPDPEQMHEGVVEGAEHIHYAENGMGPVRDFDSTDPEESPIEWDVRGVDAADFDIDSSTGVLTFIDSPDYENPTDRGLNLNPDDAGDNDFDDDGEFKPDDNNYQITVSATEMRAGPDAPLPAKRTDIALTVIVGNEDDTGELTLQWLQPEVDVEIDADLTDPDGATSDHTWTWYRSNTGVGIVPDVTDPTNWIEVTPVTANEATSSYTPQGDTVADADDVAIDEDDYLRVMVSYTDPHGSNKTMNGISTNPVRAAVSSGANASPDFQDDTDTRSVPESTAVGDPVGDPVTATDTDNDTLTYELVAVAAPNDGDDDFFDIDMATGQITVAQDLDYDSDQDRGTPGNRPDDGEYKVTVRATDPSGSTGNITVTITAVNVNEDPVVTGRAELDVAEGTTDADGDLVYTILRDAPAIGQPSTPTNQQNEYVYEDPDHLDSIARWTLEGDDAGAFDHSGRFEPRYLQFKVPPDYENPTDMNRDNVYEVTLVATDTNPLGTGAGIGKVNVWLTVANVEEAGKAVFTEGKTAYLDQMLVAEVQDPDDHGGFDDMGEPYGKPHQGVHIVSWQWSRALTDVTDTVFVDIPGATTDRYTAESSDRGYYLRATATYTDPHSDEDDPTTPGADERISTTGAPPSLRTVMATTENAVNVESGLESAPTFSEAMNGRVTRYVAEDAVSPAPVGDPVEASGENLAYTLDGPDKDDFVIDATTGQITVGADTNFNYEDADISNTYQVTVKVEVTGGDANQKAEVVVDIMVTNVDELPVITVTDADGEVVVPPMAESYPEIDEDGAPNTAAVETYVGTDPEEDTISWDLRGADAALFTIDGGMLKFREAPDYENPRDVAGANTATPDADADGNTYSVVIRAIASRVSGDTGPAETVDTTVTVTVMDEDEDGEVVISLLQPEVGTAIMASLTDPDGPRDAPLPVINTAITDAVWTWEVSKVSAVELKIDEDNHWGPPGDPNNATAVSYTPAGADLTTPATDDDDPIDEGKFLRVKATYVDGEGADKTARAMSAYPVQARDLGAKNESPDFVGDKVELSVAETAEVGDDVAGPVVAKVDTRSDTDILTYGLRAFGAGGVSDVGNTGLTAPADAAADRAAFDIDKATGQITVAQKLDFESRGNPDDGIYVVVATVTDPSGLDDSIVVVITAEDINEDPVLSGRPELTIDEIDSGDEDAANPDFDGNPDPVDQNPAVATVNVYNVVDEDRRAATNEWSLEGEDKDQFQLIGNVGRTLVFRNQPDYETPADANGDNVYKVTIVTLDGHGGRGEFDVCIAVMNINEKGKITLRDKDGNELVQPRARGPITADLTDPDGGVTGVTWQWARSQNDPPTAGDRTDIDGATTATYTPTNADDIGSFLRVTAMYIDAKNDELTEPAADTDPRMADVTATYAVLEKEDKQRSPEFPEETAMRMVAENAPSTTFVGDNLPLAMDPDDPQGDGLTYALEGDDTEFFELLSTYLGHDGEAYTEDDDYSTQIRVKLHDMGHDLDHEDEDRNGVYEVVLKVTDGSGLEDTITVTIAVTDRNEAPSTPMEGTGDAPTTPANNAPEFAAATDTREVAENTAAGENIGDPVMATDADAGDTLTYMLGGTDMASFAIDDTTGQLMTMAALDYEAPADADTDNAYEVTVTASDGNAADDATMSVTITVTDMGLADSYDANEDGMIDGTEVLNAVEDYFNDVSGIDSERILDIVELYFSS